MIGPEASFLRRKQGGYKRIGMHSVSTCICNAIPLLHPAVSSLDMANGGTVIRNGDVQPLGHSLNLQNCPAAFVASRSSRRSLAFARGCWAEVHLHLVSDSTADASPRGNRRLIASLPCSRVHMKPWWSLQCLHWLSECC